MLNGKTYLISFTALFSKKGYGLTVGVDTLYDGEKDTQYHLTAPATSTYRAMKMEEAKTGDKLPYVASSLFGGALREASIDIEVEGVEMDVVMASVTDYLANVQTHLSARAFDEEALIDNRSEGKLKQDLKDAEIDYVTSVTTFDREATRAEGLLKAEHFLGGKTGSVESNREALNLTREIKDVHDIEFYRDATRISDTPDAVIYKAVDTTKLDPLSDGVSEYVSTRNITADVKDADLEVAVDALNLSKEKDATVDVSAGTVNQSTEFDLHVIERFVDGSARLDREGSVEHYVSAEAGLNQDADLHFLTDADHALSMTGREPEEYTQSTTGAGVEGVDIPFTDVAMVQGGISDSPEVTSAVRLLNIMYGQEAARTVVAGMSELIDTVIAEGAKADSGSITEAVVSKIKGAVNSGSVVSLISAPEQAVSSSSGTGIEMTPERAQSFSSSLGRYEFPTLAVNSPSSEGEMVDIGKAIAEANRNLYLANPNVASSVAFGEGVLGAGEWAESSPSYEAQIAKREQAEYNVSYDAVGYDTETANVVSTNLGVTYEPETAVRDMSYDAVLTNMPEQGSTANMYEEAIINLPESGAKDVITVDSVIHSTEKASMSDHGYVSDAPSETEQAEPITVKLGVIDNAGATGGADITVDARLDAISNMQGDTIYDATLNSASSGETFKSEDAVTYEYSGAGSMDTVADIEIEEGTEAEMLLVTEDGAVDEGAEAIRKRRTYRTEVEEQTESERKRKTHRTSVELDVEAERKKRVIPTAVEATEEAKRPKRRLPTTIEESEEGTNLTKPEPPKNKIWLIMGKIASWSLWNWKKTR